MTASAHPTLRREIRRLLIIGSVGAMILIFGGGGWALTTSLAGAVVAPATLVVDSNVKSIQHPTGGVVSELHVRDGDHVRAGDLLVRLDETLTRANLGVLVKALNELAARQARNEAERDGHEVVSFPAELLARGDDPEIATILREEARLFASRLAARNGQKSQLQERILQYRDEIRGLTEQAKAKEKEIALIGQELKGVRTLWEAKMIPIMRLIALERDEAKISGERGVLIASIAQAKGRISEIELQILQVDQNLRAEVGRELADIRGKAAELMERRVAAEDQLNRINIRSPQDGVVHQLLVHTIGGVIPAGETMMLIVPQGEALAVEAKIAPHEVDRLRVGQKALLRFTAFNQRTTPELIGAVSRISADISNDIKTGAAFYTVRIAVSESEIASLNGLKLVPGMPVESFVQTEERTVASYLTKPLQDQIARAWKEK